MILSKTYKGRYTILGVPEIGSATAWVVYDPMERFWYVYRYEMEEGITGGREVASGVTRTQALEEAAASSWGSST